MLVPRITLAMTDPEDVTPLLAAASSGDRAALHRLLPIVYAELHRIAHRQLAGERTGHTLDTTALVHEAYMKLADLDHIRWQDRAHFFALSARVMRQVLMDYAEKRKAKKRGGGRARVSLENVKLMSDDRAEDFLVLDEALTRLESQDERMCRVVEYRFFGGLTIQEAAEVLGVSTATVKRDWNLARAWLSRELKA